MAIALFALAGSGACLSTRETPEVALLIGSVAVVVAVAAAVWILVRNGHPALYLFTAAGVLASVPAIVVGVRGGCS